MDLTFYHCQKGYYYYIEFIEQISSIDHVFLQLNSKDASTYVYKKTIYELDSETQYKIPQCAPSNIKIILDNVDEHIKVFKNIFEFIMDFVVLDNNLSININIEIIDKFKVVCQKIFSKNSGKPPAEIKKIYNEIEDINHDYHDFLNRREPGSGSGSGSGVSTQTHHNNHKQSAETYLDHITLQWK